MLYFIIPPSTVAYEAEDPVIPPTCFELFEGEDFIECELKKYDWDHTIAMAIVTAESSMRTDVVNPEQHRGCTGSVGLFQVACIHDDIEKLKDPVYNIQRAYEIYEESGWRPWGAYTNQSYLKYL